MYNIQSTPIINALKKYIDDGIVRFHMPGHKGGQINGNLLVDFLGGMVLKADVTNVPGMDDLHQTHGVIREAQEIAAAAFGADYTYFLVNGSSCGLQALVMSVCNPGDKILVPRNMHRSILSGIILSGAVPVFFMPKYDDYFGIPLGPTPEIIIQCLNEHPDLKAVIVVNPTYHGITSDLRSIAKIVHARNIPLLVDEAHGPHLSFHEKLPEPALQEGADAAVQGTHKLLSSFTQASMLHLKGNLINRQRLEAVLRLLQSTSTSYLLLASLDAARAQMVASGRQLIQNTLELAELTRTEINRNKEFSSFGIEMPKSHGAFGLDQSKVTVSVRELGITGLWAEKWLREHFNIQVEMSDVNNVLLILTFGNQCSDVERFITALRAMSKYLQLKHKEDCLVKAIQEVKLIPGLPPLEITPREAFCAPVATVPLQEAVGRISCEIIACYPPGIPVICPGEKITLEILEYLKIMRDLGMHFQGCYDPQLQTIRVIK